MVWQYAGTDQDPMHGCFGGKAEALPNGNVLAVEPQGGSIVQLARNKGDDVVWEFVNLQEDGMAGMVFDGLASPRTSSSLSGSPALDEEPASAARVARPRASIGSAGES